MRPYSSKIWGTDFCRGEGQSHKNSFVGTICLCGVEILIPMMRHGGHCPLRQFRVGLPNPRERGQLLRKRKTVGPLSFDRWRIPKKVWYGRFGFDPETAVYPNVMYDRGSRYQDRNADRRDSGVESTNKSGIGPLDEPKDDRRCTDVHNSAESRKEHQGS